MYSWKAGNEKSCTDIIEKAAMLYEEIITNCNDKQLVEISLYSLASVYSSLGRDDKAIEMLNRIPNKQCDPNDILASIYIKHKKYDEARKLLQGKLFKDINEITLVCISLGNIYQKEKNYDIAEKYFKLSLDMRNLFTADNNETVFLLIEYLQLAQLYVEIGKNHKVIEMLNRLIESYRKYNQENIDQFNQLWCFNELEQSEYPIKANLYENLYFILNDRKFNAINKDKEFIKIIDEIEQLKGE
ncbi:hypothetical protein SH1V18_03700 [Vallitalea longa]|uniref:Tetratricopeptide repeat protein n=1 Tax=Vallitalea longa TaxID=2936439 RepID=A0A9W5Y8G6_9FIRM|nr:tetratricopeptide repeat protein [Vallitalea longa]GKX27890.1 hypothetical protein SH1V18_03700 [Vallitalea longa]